MTTYNSEFKLVVAKEAMHSKTYREVGEKYGIPVENVRGWMRAYKKYGELAFEKDGPQQHEEQRVKELERRILDLEEENAILKKATAVFSKYLK